jgi:CHAT domain-containing protein
MYKPSYEKAIEYCLEALRIFRPETRPKQYAKTQAELGNIYYLMLTTNRQMNLEKAIECYEEALRFLTPEDSPEDYASLQNALGNVYAELLAGDRISNIERSITHFREALRFLDLEKTPHTYAIVQNNLALTCCMHMGDTRPASLFEAVDHYKKALQVLTPTRYPIDYATTQSNVGDTYLQIASAAMQSASEQVDNIKSAIRCFQEALRFESPQSVFLNYAITLDRLGNAYLRLAKVEESTNEQIAAIQKAIKYYREALRFRTLEAAPLEYAMTQTNLGNAYKELPAGNTVEHQHEAITCFQKALAVFTAEATPLDCRRTARYLADLYSEQGRWREAYDTYRLALRAAERLYRFAYQPTSQQIEIQENAALYANMIRACLRLTSDPACCRDGIVAAEEGKARLFLDQLGQGDYPLPPGVPKVIISEEANLISQLRTLELSLCSSNTSADEKRALVQQREAVQESLEACWEKLILEYPHSQDYVSLRRGQPPTWSKLLELTLQLGAETALIEFFTLEEEIAAFVLRSDKDAPLVFSLPISGKRLLHRYLEPYNDEILHRIPGRNREHSWLDLGAELLTPLLGELEGIELIYIIPHGWLHLLPLHALTVQKKPFIAHKAVVYAPSAAVLSRTLERMSDRRQICSSLVVGYTSSKEVKEREIFLGEAQDIASYFGTAPHLDRNATLEQLKTHLEKAELVHLSCHGYFDKQDPLASSVLLANGELTARNMMSLQLQAELVTLSACQTGFSEIELGDEIVGFSRALLYAGAGSTLLTLWSVDALTTRTWMRDFYRIAWSPKGQPLVDKARAFQQAVLALRENYGDPYYWAPFVLTGNAC